MDALYRALGAAGGFAFEPSAVFVAPRVPKASLKYPTLAAANLEARESRTAIATSSGTGTFEDERPGRLDDAAGGKRSPAKIAMVVAGLALGVAGVVFALKPSSTATPPAATARSRRSRRRAAAAPAAAAPTPAAPVAPAPAETPKPAAATTAGQRCPQAEPLAPSPSRGGRGTEGRSAAPGDSRAGRSAGRHQAVPDQLDGNPQGWPAISRDRSFAAMCRSVAQTLPR